MNEPTYLEKSMFGCRGCYFQGRLVIVLASRRQEPWKGLLIPTMKECHDSLIGEFPDLEVHPILRKWLYLSESTDAFEEVAQRLIDLIICTDPRIGVTPQPRKHRIWKTPPAQGSNP